jgi:hypothetical protein
VSEHSLRSAASAVADEVCSYLCPSTFKTAEGQTHDPRCSALRAALAELAQPRPAEQLDKTGAEGAAASVVSPVQNPAPVEFEAVEAAMSARLCELWAEREHPPRLEVQGNILDQLRPLWAAEAARHAAELAAAGAREVEWRAEIERLVAADATDTPDADAWLTLDARARLVSRLKRLPPAPPGAGERLAKLLSYFQDKALDARAQANIDALPSDWTTVALAFEHAGECLREALYGPAEGGNDG